MTLGRASSSIAMGQRTHRSSLDPTLAQAHTAMQELKEPLAIFPLPLSVT